MTKNTPKRRNPKGPVIVWDGQEEENMHGCTYRALVTPDKVLIEIAVDDEEEYDMFGEPKWDNLDTDCDEALLHALCSLLRHTVQLKGLNELSETKSKQ